MVEVLLSNTRNNNNNEHQQDALQMTQYFQTQLFPSSGRKTTRQVALLLFCKDHVNLGHWTKYSVSVSSKYNYIKLNQTHAGDKSSLVVTITTTTYTPRDLGWFGELLSLV